MPDAPLITAPALNSAQVEIILKYEGKDVDDGTMPIDDVISALKGFSSAYGKIASSDDPNGQHQIRVSAISKSSFAVSILAWALENKAIIAATLPVAGAIVTLILKLIELKKATKGRPIANIQINGNNNTVSFNAGDNTVITVEKRLYDLFASKKLDGELGKIAAPLREGKVDAVSLSAKDQRGAIAESPVVITSSERESFQNEEVITTTSKPVSIDGQLVSLNKESNRGSFRMQNGTRVPYHLGGENPISMYPDFAYRGPVRIECVATFDGNLELKGIEIESIARLQPPLPFSE